MRQNMKLVSLLLILVLLVAGCLPTPQPTQAEWTFMVYMDGDNNLEGAAIDDFLEMAEIGSSDEVKIVVQMDRTHGYSGSYDDWTETRRFLIEEDDTPSGGPLQNLGEQNMGDPDVLEDFITWAVTNYPAKHYLLSIWDHGDGWRLELERRAAEAETKISDGERNVSVARTISSDETDNDVLYMAEVQQALEGAYSDTSVKLDVVGFDACLMGMVEVAYGIRDYADYMVGSEDTEPGDGWPYNTVLADLAATPGVSPQQLAELIVDYYVDSYPTGSGITQAASDVSKVGALVTKIDNFASAADREWDELEAARENTLEYHPWGCAHSCWGVDLWDFADEVNRRVASTSMKAAADELKTAIDDFVIAERHSPDRAESHGIAIYFPEDQGTFDADPDHTGYEQVNTFMPVDFVHDHNWDEWLQDFYSDHSDQPDLVVEVSSPASAVAGSDVEVPAKVRNNGGGPASGTVSASSNGYMVDIVLSSDTNVPDGWATYSPTYKEDVLLKGGRISNTDDLAPGDEKLYQYSYGTPADTPAGDYYICARIDPGKKVAESDEGNNVSCTPIRINSTSADKPDLVVKIVSIDNTTIVWGQEPWTWITYRVSNVGSASTPGGQIFLRDWTNGSPTSGYMVVEGPIPPGGSTEGKFAVGHDNVWPVGEYTVQMEVDYRSLIDEADEDNNLSNSIEFTVVP